MDRYFLEFLKRLQQLKTGVTVNYIDEYFYPRLGLVHGLL